MEIAVSIATPKTVDRILDHWGVSIKVCFHQHGSILARVRHLQYICSFLNTYISIVCNLGTLILNTLFGRDEYNTIGSSYTIDCCSRSILQNCHILNIIIVDEVDVIIEHTINNIERRTVSERTDSTDTHCRTSTRRTTIYDVHTCNLTLQGRHRRRRRCRLDIISLDNGDRRSQILGLSRTVTDDYHIIEVLEIIVQNYFQVISNL